MEPRETRSSRIYELCQEYLPDQPLRKKGVTLDTLISLLRVNGVPVNSDGTLAPDGVFKTKRKRYKFDSYLTGCDDVDLEILLRVPTLVSLRAACLTNKAVQALVTGSQQERFHQRLLERFLTENLAGRSNYRGAWITFSSQSILREPKLSYFTAAACCVNKITLGKLVPIAAFYKLQSPNIAKAAALDLGETTISLVRNEIREITLETDVTVVAASYYAALLTGRVDVFLDLLRLIFDLRDTHRKCRDSHNPLDQYHYFWGLDLEILEQGTPEKIEAFLQYSHKRYGEKFKEVLGYVNRLEAVYHRGDPQVYLTVLPYLRPSQQKKVVTKILELPMSSLNSFFTKFRTEKKYSEMLEKAAKISLKGGPTLQSLEILIGLEVPEIEEDIRQWFQGSAKAIGIYTDQKRLVVQKYRDLEETIDHQTSNHVLVRHYGEAWGGTEVYIEKSLEALSHLIYNECRMIKGSLFTTSNTMYLAELWTRPLDLLTIPTEKANELVQVLVGPRAHKSTWNTLSFLDLFFGGENFLRASKESLEKILELLRKFPKRSLGDKGILVQELIKSRVEAPY